MDDLQPRDTISNKYKRQENMEKYVMNIGGTTYEVTDELKDALKGLKEVK
jgi:hypothetical protein